MNIYKEVVSKTPTIISNRGTIRQIKEATKVDLWIKYDGSFKDMVRINNNDNA